MQLSRFKKHWGFLIFAVSFGAAFVISVTKALKGVPSPDFDVFLGSARLLLAGKNPYGVDYPVGQYLYSPAAGLFFYSFFANISYSASLALYTALLSAGFLLPLWALTKFESGTRKKSQSDLRKKSLFFFLLSFEALGSLLNYKLELLIVGICFSVIVAFRDKRMRALSLVFLAIFSNFKLQGLAASLILLATLDWNKKNLRYWIAYVGTFAAVFFLPAVFLGWNRNLEIHKLWHEDAGAFMVKVFYDRTHIWGFLRSIFNLEFSTTTISIVTLIAAILFFIYAVWMKFLEFKTKQQSEYARVLRAFSLGGVFTLIFSPAAQSSAYVLLAPLYWNYTQLLPGTQSKKLTKLLWYIGFVLALLFISLGYSDLVGPTMQKFCREHFVKAFGAAMLLLFYLYFDQINRKSAPHSE